MKRRPVMAHHILVRGKFVPILSMTAKPERKRKHYRQPERALHAHVGQLLKWLKPKCVYFPVPNGAADLGAKMGGMLKAQHKLYPGVSDWIFMWGWIDEYIGRQAEFDKKFNMTLGCTCGAIELKIGKNPQSDDQKIFEGDCKLQGIPYRIARTVDEVVDILVEWGRLPRGTRERIRGFNPQ